jgi:hypothetical protein
MESAFWSASTFTARSTISGPVFVAQISKLNKCRFPTLEGVLKSSQDALCDYGALFYRKKAE